MSRRVRPGAGAPSACLVLEIEVHDGEPAAVIRDVAHERGTGMVAMTTRGSTELARTFLGNTAGRVLRYTNLPGMFVRPPEDLGRTLDGAADTRVTSPEGPSDSTSDPYWLDSSGGRPGGGDGPWMQSRRQEVR